MVLLASSSMQQQALKLGNVSIHQLDTVDYIIFEMDFWLGLTENQIQYVSILLLGDQVYLQAITSLNT